MRLFIAGFLTGFIIKNPGLSLSILSSLVKPFNKKKIKWYTPRYYVLAKIHNPALFEEMFPPIVGSKHRTQPHWEYYPNKQVIKIEITETDEMDMLDYDAFLELSGLDLEFFKAFSDLWIYEHYFIDKKEYIKVYENNENNAVIHENNENNSRNNCIDNMICAMFHTEQKEYYVTKYVKMFQYNDKLTTEHLLLYYSELDRLDAKLKIVTNQDIKTYSLKETI
jgi:hypothetical protein